MGLDDFKEEDEYAEGTVKTRKKPENISLGESEWKWFLMHEPSWLDALGRQVSLKDAKAMVQMVDELLAGDETQYGAASDQQKAELRQHREELIEHIKEEDD